MIANQVAFHLHQFVDFRADANLPPVEVQPTWHRSTNRGIFQNLTEATKKTPRPVDLHSSIMPIDSWNEMH